MDKLTRQREMVKNIATEPWVHTFSSLTKMLGVTQTTVVRDFEEMQDNGFQFRHDARGTLYLQASGWNGVMPVKASTLSITWVLGFGSAAEPVELRELNLQRVRETLGNYREEMLERS